MIEPSWLLLGLLLPMLIGAVGIGLLVRRIKGLTSPLPPLGWSLAIGLGASVGMLALIGFPPWKSLEARHWVLSAVLPAAVVVGMLNAVPGFPWVVHWLLRLGMIFGTLYVLLQSPISRWTTNEKLAWLGGIGSAMMVIWALLHRYAMASLNQSTTEAADRTKLLVFALGATAGAIGGTTIASGSIIDGQFTASFAAAVGGGWLAVLGSKAGPVSPRGVVDVIFPVGFGLLVAGWHYAWRMQNPASPHIVAGLLAVAPLGLWVTAIPWVRSRPAGQRTLWSFIAVFLLIFAALGLAGYEAALRSQASGPSYY